MRSLLLIFTLVTKTWRISCRKRSLGFSSVLSNRKRIKAPQLEMMDRVFLFATGEICRSDSIR